MAMDFHPTAFKRMLNGRIVINASSSTALQVDSSNMSERKWLLIQNSADEPIYIGSQYSSSGTPTTITAYYLGKYGIKMASGDMMWLPVSDSITVYARAHSGPQVVRIVELA